MPASHDPAAVDLVDLSELTAPERLGEPTFVWMPGERGWVYVANVFIGVVGAFAVFIGIGSAIGYATKGQPVTALVYLAVAGATALLIAAAIVRAVVRRKRYGIRSVLLGPRLPAFAAANALDFDAQSNDIRVPITEDRPDYRVIDRQVRGRLTSAHDDGKPGFELGDYVWTVDHGGGKKGIGTYAYAYVAVRMPRALPLIVLQSTVPGSAEYLADREQVLELEGDWGKYFTGASSIGMRQMR